MLRKNNLRPLWQMERRGKEKPWFSGSGLDSAINKDRNVAGEVYWGTTMINSILSMIWGTSEKYLLKRVIQKAIREINVQFSQKVHMEKSDLGVIVSVTVASIQLSLGIDTNKL